MLLKNNLLQACLAHTQLSTELESNITKDEVHDIAFVVEFIVTIGHDEECSRAELATIWTSSASRITCQHSPGGY